MENDYNDNLIITHREKINNKYKSTIKFFFGVSIFLCIIAYILIDTNIYSGYEFIISKNETISSEYKYIFLFDLLYSLWYLFIYIYIICYNNNKIKYLYFLIASIYFANIIYHIVSNIIIVNKLKKLNLDVLDEDNTFIYYCICVFFNSIMSLLFIKYVDLNKN